MIDHKLPKNWKDLQNKVAEIFKEIGYKTEIEKDIQTGRGETVNIDVFAVDEDYSPNIVYLCECKYWEKNIPKKEVYAFKAIVQDFGANYGIIISKKDFQEGAHKVAKNTNIKLVNWFSFQDMLEEKWFQAITKRTYDKYEKFTDYTEPLLPTYLLKKMKQLDKKKWVKFEKIRQRYMLIGSLLTTLRFGPMFLDISGKKQKRKFPFFLSVPTKVQNKSKLKKIHSLREFIDCIAFYCKKGMEEFNEIIKR